MWKYIVELWNDIFNAVSELIDVQIESDPRDDVQ